MYRRFFMIGFILLFLLLTACTQKNTSAAGELNIMCRSFFADNIESICRMAQGEDQLLTQPHCITEEDYTDYTSWHDAISTGLLTKSNDFDIFMLSSLDESAYKIIKDNYYVNLSQDDGLKGYFDAMYPEIQDWCTFGDDLYGFPMALSYHMEMSADETQTEMLGYTPDEIISMEDLLAFCDTWHEKKGTAPTDGILYMPEYYMNYMLTHYDRATGELDLNSPTFRTILTQCHDLYKNSYLYREQNSPAGNPIVFYSGDPFFKNYKPLDYPQIEGEKPDTKRFTSITWFVINPYSDNKEQAFKFLRLWAESAKFINFNGLLYKERDFYNSEKPYGYGSNQPKSEVYTADQFQVLTDYLKGRYIGYGFPGYSDIIEKLNAYVVDSTKTLDEAITEAQHIIDTVQKEQHIGMD